MNQQLKKNSLSFLNDCLMRSSEPALDYHIIQTRRKMNRTIVVLLFTQNICKLTTLLPLCKDPTFRTFAWFTAFSGCELKESLLVQKVSSCSCCHPSSGIFFVSSCYICDNNNNNNCEAVNRLFKARSIQPNFRKFWSKTQWIGSVQPEKFRKNRSTFWGGPLFPVGPVWILVEWIAPSVFV